VDRLTVSCYTVPTDRPEADGTFAWDSTTMALVEVQSGDTTGIGWTYGPAACGAFIRERLEPVVTGADAFAPASAQRRMVEAVRNDGRAGIAAGAISAVDIALWDLKARLLDLPLHRLLGAQRASVDVYGSGGFTTYDAATQDAQLRGWVEAQGIPRVKIKIGENRGRRTERDRERIAAARASIGDAAELFVDANGAYSAKQAIRLARDITESRVTWFEEPVSSDDLAGLAAVKRAIDADVAAGEYGYDLAYLRRLCESGAVDCLQADATRCGGITEWMRVAAVAQSFGLDLSAHCAPHVHAHAATAIDNPRHLEWFHDHVRIESLFFDGTLDPQGGSVTPRDGEPGLGLRFRSADAAPFRVA
jgi:L-alanine-DL-glutamate epimerase-like enolase superfamily enzyme